MSLGSAQIEPAPAPAAERRRSFGVNIGGTQDPKTKKQIRDLMERFDTNRDGKLNANEILDLHNELVRKQKQEQNLKHVAAILFVMLCLSVLANFGTAIASNVLTRVTRIRSARLTDPGDGNLIISTGKASVNIPLYLVPLAGVDIVDNVRHMQFTGLDVEVTSGLMVGNYTRLIYGLEVRSYLYFDETTVLLRGSTSERLLINDGAVTAWGFDGMDPEATFHVCPGSVESGKVACSLYKANDVDIAALEAKAKDLGISPTSGTTRRLQHEDSRSYHSPHGESKRRLGLIQPTRAPTRKPTSSTTGVPTFQLVC